MVGEFKYRDIYVMGHLVSVCRNGNVRFNASGPVDSYNNHGLDHVIRYCQYILGCKRHQVCILNSVESNHKRAILDGYTFDMSLGLFGREMDRSELISNVDRLFSKLTDMLLNFIVSVDSRFFTPLGVNPLSEGCFDMSKIRR